MKSFKKMNLVSGFDWIKKLVFFGVVFGIFFGILFSSHKALASSGFRPPVPDARISKTNIHPATNVEYIDEVAPGSEIYLWGEDSFDLDGDSFSYSWVCNGGEIVGSASLANVVVRVDEPYHYSSGTFFCQLITAKGSASDSVLKDIVNFEVKGDGPNPPPVGSDGRVSVSDARISKTNIHPTNNVEFMEVTEKELSNLYIWGQDSFITYSPSSLSVGWDCNYGNGNCGFGFAGSQQQFDTSIGSFNVNRDRIIAIELLTSDNLVFPHSLPSLDYLYISIIRDPTVFTINSIGASGVRITDNFGTYIDSTNFTTINDRASVSFVAPLHADGLDFFSWTGCDNDKISFMGGTSGGNFPCHMLNATSFDRTVTVEYRTRLKVTSLGSSDIPITSTTGDEGNTHYEKAVPPGSSHILTAPAIAPDGATFTSWSGCSSVDERTCYVTMGEADQSQFPNPTKIEKTVTANYKMVLVAPSPDFTLNITPNSTIIANPGQTKSYLIGTNFINGFSGPVTLSVSDVTVSDVTQASKKNNLVRSFTKDGVIFSSTINLNFSGDQAYLAVKDDQEADRGTNFNIIIRGKNGSLEHTYSRVFHINQKPVARFRAVTPTTGPAPLTVSFRDGDVNGASYDPDSLAPLIYTADLDTDGIVDKCYIPPVYIPFLGNCESVWPGSDAADPRTSNWTFVYNQTMASYAVIDISLAEGFITLSEPAAIAITTGSSPLQPDLIASVITPTTAITGDPQTYTSTISNVGADAAGPITHLFQYDNDSDHSSGVTTGTDTTGGILAGGVIAISDSHTFATSGTKYVRACADNDASFVGTVPESDETNNCSGSWTTVTVSAIPQCSNGLDDDGDTKIDFGADPSNDPGCSSFIDNDETDPPPQPECFDGIDNDGDTKIDFGAGPNNDPDCSSLIDNDEFNPNSGSCAPEHYSCLNGSSGDNENHTANWTWTCAGSDGIPVSCSERHKQPDWIED